MKHSKLSRRWRKKLHVGEFQEFGFQIEVRFKTDLDESFSDKFYTNFIALIEANNLAFGGGGNNEYWQGFVSAWEKFRSPTIEQRDKIEKWLESQPEIEYCEVGKLVDAWYDVK